MRTNPYLNKLHTFRLRNEITLHDHGGSYTAHVETIVYDHKAWDKRCGVLQGAKIISAQAASLSVLLNDPGEIYSPYTPGGDHVFSFLEKINAFPEPLYMGMIAEGVWHYRSGLTGRPFSLLTCNGKLPWAPLTVAEYLDAFENYTREKIQQFTRDKKNIPAPEELLQELHYVRQFRDSLTAEKLSKQAIIGNGRFHLWEDSYVQGQPLSRMIPGFMSNSSNKNAIRLITVWYDARDIDLVTDAWIAIDYHSLRELMK